MNRPLVSVIVPVYNAAPFLDELCESIRAQTYPNFEALFLDDGSSDGSKGVIEKYGADRRFKIMSWPENRGVTEATAALLRKMQGAYWCHPGADDVLEPQFIERRLQVAQQYPGAALIHGPGANIDERGTRLPEPVLPGPMPALLAGERALHVLLEHNVINTPGVFVETAVTRAVLARFRGPWRFAQDWFLWLLHVATGRPLVWHEEKLHRYRIHSRSLTQALDARPAANRAAETRLVPLCALAEAQGLSAGASACWNQWRQTLYALWLRRALNLRCRNQLRPEWLAAAQRACYGERPAARSLLGDCVRHAGRIVTATWRESCARKRNRFRVSGLAQVGDALFR